RTLLNAEGRFRGRQDAPLDEQGWIDAHWAGSVLAGEDLEGVYASPLTRARETASEVARRHDLVPKEMPDLIDLDYGAWEGLTARRALSSILEGRARRGVRRRSGSAPNPRRAFARSRPEAGGAGGSPPSGTSRASPIVVAAAVDLRAAVGCRSGERCDATARA